MPGTRKSHEGFPLLLKRRMIDRATAAQQQQPAGRRSHLAHARPVRVRSIRTGSSYVYRSR